ncbi:hypothetical protein MY04_5323 [Flammeovirga sp. MY04]|uniref:C45 family autoproteolytic acyltransferase/hydolase n=1 Tax=Flammeovirga sp. MY04 TaxID=1191459 RepID=UPI00080615D9|nr:C45 family peptidase [Flammeovirga sp. MY04]ANQ52655.1 hypothetical protein MY04_5323 [Flammeovirga sp. MY04]
MKYLIHYSIILPILSVLFLNSFTSKAGIPPVYHQIELEDNSNFYTVEAEGNYRDVGLAHGKKFKKEIHYMLNRFRFELVEPMMVSVGLEANYEAYKKYCLENTSFVSMIKKHTPGLYQEVKGIADGSEQDIEDILCYNISFDELFLVLEEMSGTNPSLVKGNRLNGHCSAGAVWDKGMSSVSYTCDWAKTFEGAQALMKYNIDGKVLFISGYVGTIGIQGINLEKGFSLNAHSKFDLAGDINTGLPSLFFARELLESESKKAAVKRLKELPIAVGIGYVLTDKDGVTAYEISAHQKTEVVCGDHWFAIANDIRANTDMKPSVRNHFNIKKVDFDNFPKEFLSHNADCIQRYDLIADFASQTNIKKVDWLKVFQHYPIAKKVTMDIPVTNFWIIVEFDDEYIDIQTTPSHPGGMELETYRVKYN